eukprot:scaffold8536_cov36-Cyclotella_meneghiniana.AAC.5
MRVAYSIGTLLSGIEFYYIHRISFEGIINFTEAVTGSDNPDLKLKVEAAYKKARNLVRGRNEAAPFTRFDVDLAKRVIFKSDAVVKTLDAIRIKHPLIDPSDVDEFIIGVGGPGSKFVFLQKPSITDEEEYELENATMQVNEILEDSTSETQVAERNLALRKERT